MFPQSHEEHRKSLFFMILLGEAVTWVLLVMFTGDFVERDLWQQVGKDIRGKQDRQINSSSAVKQQKNYISNSGGGTRGRAVVAICSDLNPVETAFFISIYKTDLPERSIISTTAVSRCWCCLNVCVHDYLCHTFHGRLV